MHYESKDQLQAYQARMAQRPMLTTLQYEEQDSLIDALEAEVTEQIRRVRLFEEAFGETQKTTKIEYVLTCVQDDLRRIGREHDDDDDDDE